MSSAPKVSQKVQDGGPEKGDEMADGSTAEGPGSMNDSHSSFYDKYDVYGYGKIGYYGTMVGYINKSFIGRMIDFFTKPWSKEWRDALREINEEQIRRNVKEIGRVYEEHYVDSKIADYKNPATAISFGIQSFDNGRGITNKCHDGQNFF